jgi:alpha-glucosidase
LKVIFHGLHSTHVTVNGTVRGLHHEVNRFFAALEKFDPIYDPEPAPQEDVLTTELEYIKEQIALQW